MGNPQIAGGSSVEQSTLEYLWNAANELKGVAPTISQRLASKLVASVSEDGMSSFAKRKHCDGCASLLLSSKVRVRKVMKKTRRRPESFRNVIISTCNMCGTPNVEKGARRDCRPRADEAEMEKLKRRLLKKAKKEERTDAGTHDDSKGGTEVEKVAEVSLSSTKKKRKRKKSKGSKNEGKKAKGSNSGLAASFLFDPL